MQRLVILATIIVVAAPARADLGAAMVVHASQYAGFKEGGGGVLLEASRRRGRLEPFAELGLSVVSASRGEENLGAGAATSLLGGLRVIPRSYAADEAAIELAIDVFAGGQYIKFSGDRETRPLIGVGAGWQVRFYGRRTVRVMTRIFAAPSVSDRDAPVCRGACPGEARETAYGFMGSIGASW